MWESCQACIYWLVTCSLHHVMVMKDSCQAPLKASGLFNALRLGLSIRHPEVVVIKAYTLRLRRRFLVCTYLPSVEQCTSS